VGDAGGGAPGEAGDCAPGAGTCAAIGPVMIANATVPIAIPILLLHFTFI
jgi:hypothetical protein